MTDNPPPGTASRSDAQSRPRLLDRVREAIRMRHYSRRTEEAYAHWIRRFIVFHGRRHPNTMGAAEITAFLSWLAAARAVSASTQNQAASALLFLYRHVLHIDVGALGTVTRAKRPERVSVVLTEEEAARLLSTLDGVVWIVVALLYGSGLRLQECLELRLRRTCCNVATTCGPFRSCSAMRTWRRR